MSESKKLQIEESKPSAEDEGIYARTKRCGKNEEKKPKTLKEDRLYKPHQREFVNYARGIIEAIRGEDQQHNLGDWTAALLNCNQVSPRFSKSRNKN